MIFLKQQTKISTLKYFKQTFPRFNFSIDESLSETLFTSLNVKQQVARYVLSQIF